jgi:hypothetical protein
MLQLDKKIGEKSIKPHGKSLPPVWTVSTVHKMRELLDVLTVPHFPKKHWTASSGWEMADHLAKVLADHIKNGIGAAAFFLYRQMR